MDILLLFMLIRNVKGIKN